MHFLNPLPRYLSEVPHGFRNRKINKGVMKMKKIILPALAASMLMSMPAKSQVSIYRDPFDTLFDTMIFNPQQMQAHKFVGPKMDVADLQDKIEIKAELPGMNENDVNVTIKDAILTLSGERKETTEEQNKAYYIKETSSGAFSRSVRLPDNIDESRIEAVFKDGILTIVIPKTEVKENTGRKIPINKGE